jgi:hypothetical protein
MQRMARSMVGNLLPDRGPEASTESAGADFTTKSTVHYQTVIQVHKKPHKIIAQHSGTRVIMYKWSGTARTFTGGISFCNHGGCPYMDGMALKCTYTTPKMGSYRVPVRNGVGTCATPYRAIGRSGHHNCHDDSSTQVKAVRGLSYSVWSGRCGDSSFSAYAPACDGT